MEEVTVAQDELNDIFQNIDTDIDATDC